MVECSDYKQQAASPSVPSMGAFVCRNKTLTKTPQVVSVKGTAGFRLIRALQNRSFAFRPAGPQALPEYPVERSGPGFLPDSKLGRTRVNPDRVP